MDFVYVHGHFSLSKKFPILIFNEHIYVIVISNTEAWD